MPEGPGDNAGVDSMSREARSRIMSAIRGKDTGPELILRSALFARGFRFRVNCKGLPGKPDIKLTKHRALVLVHGCFWHGHHCRYFRPPAGNSSFWEEKIGRNRERDLRDVEALREAGWRVCVVWECAIRKAASGKDAGLLVDSLEKWIRGKSPFLELFDPEATFESGDPAPGRGKGLGKNSDPALFAAERTGPWGPLTP
jgi:DNA mismatch endonuclease, patch repair protein